MFEDYIRERITELRMRKNFYKGGNPVPCCCNECDFLLDVYKRQKQ